MKNLSLAVIAALASQALAEPEPMPYKPVKVLKSARDIFGLDRRDTDGYHPNQSICGIGLTCADACGDTYDQCASSDNQLHCYDVQSSELCCSDGTGNSCDAGYYCSADSDGQTWCCPEGMDLDTCASKYQVTGGLHSDSATLTSSTTTSTHATSTPVVSVTTSSITSSAASSTAPPTISSTTSSNSSSITSSAPSSTASSSASSKAPISSAFVAGGIFFDTGNSTTAVAHSTGATSTHSGAMATVYVSTTASDAASATGSSTSRKSGASASSSVNFLALLGAAVFAASSFL